MYIKVAEVKCVRYLELLYVVVVKVISHRDHRSSRIENKVSNPVEVIVASCCMCHLMLVLCCVIIFRCS